MLGVGTSLFAYIVLGMTPMIFVRSSCAKSKRFCDRGLPCGHCIRMGRAQNCSRDEGLRALPKRLVESKVRPQKRALSTERAETIARKNLDQPMPKKLKNIENEPSDAVVTSGLECPQPEKPPGIGQPCVWCEVSRTFRK